MFDSALIDIAIGLSLVFLLFSLVVSAATELFASVFKWRANHLWEGIATLLQSTETRTKVFNHALIKGLATGLPVGTRLTNGKKGPSYIPSKTFALALIDVVREPHKAADALMRRVDLVAAKLTRDPKGALAEIDSAITAALDNGNLSDGLKTELETLRHTWLAKVDASTIAPLVDRMRAAADAAQDAAVKADLQQWIDLTRNATGIELKTELEKIVNRIPPEADGHRVRALLTEIAAAIPAGDPRDLQQALKQFSGSVAAAIVSEVGGPLRESLRALLNDAASSTERFRENVEVWFNDGMDRVAGSYKRHTMKWQFGISIVLAVVMNVDALLIARALWREPTLREAIAKEGISVAQAPPPSLAPRPKVFPSEAENLPLRVELASAFIEAGDTQTAYVSAPAAAEDAPATINVLGSHIKIQSANGDTSNPASFTIEKGKTSQVVLAADPLTTESLERLEVTAGDQTVPVEVDIIPPADQRFRDVSRQLSELGLPIGWSCGPAASSTQGGANAAASASSASVRTLPVWCGGGAIGDSGISWLLSYVAVLLGWTLTAAAASLGAPFWFDLLKRVVSIRSAGKAPEERPLAPKEVPQPREPGERPVDADLTNALRR